ncbi:MAG: polysaccharide biosynthesis tyrosine autokinase [Phycisphaerae bacterium]|nr:polysaccharide biosynthesis tyrosine autokinase [Phycisphaerae bacterium]
MSQITTVPGTPMPPMVQVPLSPGMRPSGPPMPQQAFTPQDIIRMLKKRIWLIVIVAILVFVGSGVGTYFWAKYYPTYRATALVEVKSPNPPAPMEKQGQLPNKDIMEQHINTQARMIKAMGILNKALEDPVVRGTSWYQSFGNDVPKALLDMDERLAATPIRDTWFINVGFAWRHDGESAQIVNAILDQYLRRVSDASQGRSRTDLALYQRRAQELLSEISLKKAALARDRASYNIPVIERRQADVGAKVASLNELLEERLTGQEQAQSLYDMYHRPGAQTSMADTPEMRQAVDFDPLVRTYTAQLADARLNLETAREYRPKHGLTLQLERQIQTIERQLNARKSELLAENFRQMSERTQVELDGITREVISLQNRMVEAKHELDDLEAHMAKYRADERDIQNLEEQLATVNDHIMRLRIQQEDPELVRVSISRAERPLERSSPSFKVNLPAGLMLGLMLGVGFAFLLEFLSSTVKTPADVVRQLHLPLLGQVPSQEDDEASPEDMNKLLIESPHSILAESFRQLRTNFLFAGPPEQQRTVLVTSCSPEEGKTCIAVNLATSLALAGQKVLLIDANFRRPSAAEAFGLSDGQQGLSDILVGRASASNLIRPTQHDNLDVLPAGPLPPNPAELLGNDHLKGLLQELKGRYQTIILDGPPLLVVSDALVLATAVDTAILTIRAGHTARGAILRAREQLRRVNARLSGIVLNDVRITRGGYFRQMYRTYYEYHAPEGLLEKDGEEQPEAEEVKSE